jgi:hypothetical protein
MNVKTNHISHIVQLVLLILLIEILSSCNKKNITYHSITGSWRVEEINPINGTRVYIVEIDRSKSDTSQYLISNFYDTDINEFVYAQLRVSTLTIPDQTITSYRVRSGTGTVSGDFTKIDFTYNIYDGSDVKVQANYSRPN